MRVASMHAWPLLLLAVAIGCQNLDETRGHGLAALLSAHVQAMGGAPAQESMASLRVVVEITEGDAILTGVYAANRQGQVRVDVYDAGRRVFSEGIDEGTGWQWPDGADAPVPMSAAGEAAMRRGVLGNLFGLHEFPDQGAELRLGRPQRVDGELFDVIDVDFRGGFERRYYLDSRSHLLRVVRSAHALHPDLDPEHRPMEERLLDYRRVDGVLRSFGSEQRDLTTGEVVQRTRVLRMETNPAIAPDAWRPRAFAVPAI